jgi:hypothetical protein
MDLTSRGKTIPHRWSPLRSTYAENIFKRVVEWYQQSECNFVSGYTQEELREFGIVQQVLPAVCAPNLA